MIYTYQELKELPVLSTGHFADLKFEGIWNDMKIRIWVSRMTIADGELDPVSVERLVNGCWIDVTTGPDAIIVCEWQGTRQSITMSDGTVIKRDNK